MTLTATGEPKETCLNISNYDLEAGILRTSSLDTTATTATTASSTALPSTPSSPDVLPTFIFVRDYEGKSVVINIDDNTTVDQVCAAALRRAALQSVVAPYPNRVRETDRSSEVPVIEELRLQYGGRTLNGSMTLRECNIQPGATLDLSTRLKGGIDGMTIMAFAILGAIALYLVYRLVLLMIKFGKWMWRFLLRAPVCWCNKNCCYPLCHTVRFAIYTCKETCCALCDCCDLHYHPWKRMDITS